MDYNDYKNSNSETEQTLSDCCDVVAEVESLQLLFNLTTDQALEVLRISELRRHRRVMGGIDTKLKGVVPLLRTIAGNIEVHTAYEHEGLRY